jgi:hypothetical protein
MRGDVVDASPVFALVQLVQDRIDLDGYDVIRRYRLADLTRIQFGNDYEEALAAVAAQRSAGASGPVRGALRT